MIFVGAACEYFDAEAGHWLCAKVVAVDEDMSRVKIDLVPDYWLRQGSSRLRQLLHPEDIDSRAATQELPVHSSNGGADIQDVQCVDVHPSNGDADIHDVHSVQVHQANVGADIQAAQSVQVYLSTGGGTGLQCVQPVQVCPSSGGTADIQIVQPAHMQQQRQLQPQQNRFPVLPNTVPMVDGVERLEPEEIHLQLCTGDCLLVDVRGDDRICGWIAGSAHIPAVEKGEWVLGARMAELASAWSSRHLVVFHCQYSCHRAPHCANTYKEHAPPGQRVGLLAGGFRGWEQCGLPIQKPLVDDCAEKGADSFALLQGFECARRAGA